MKKVTTLFLFLLFVPFVYSEPVMEVIYFKTKEAEDIDIDKHDKILKAIQGHYQSEMTKHGYIDYTFPLTLDKSGKLVIHVVNGKHNGEHYNNYPSAYDAYIKSIKPELPFEFNNDLNVNSRDNVFLIILGGVGLDNWTDNLGMGFTWHHGRFGGIATLKLEAAKKFPNHYLALITHELGHAFGLDPGHNGVRQALNGLEIAFGVTVNAWGEKMKLLKTEADFLKTRPMFRKINLKELEPELETSNKNPELVEENEQGENPQAIYVKPTRVKLTTIWAKLKTL